jgi:hypothetical protein
LRGALICRNEVFLQKWILLLLFVVNDVNGLRGTIKHVNKSSNEMPPNPIQGPVTLNNTEEDEDEEATKALLRKQPISLNLVQANVTPLFNSRPLTFVASFPDNFLMKREVPSWPTSLPVRLFC